MEKKYEFTGEERKLLGRTLKRIRALRDFRDVKRGDLGGLIESERNLSHEGNAWIYGNGVVYDDGEVCGNGVVYGNGEIKKPSDLISIEPIGSRNDTTTFFRTKDGSIAVKCGCFRGSIDEFREKVKKTHKGNKYEKEYLLAADLAEVGIFGEDETDD